MTVLTATVSKQKYRGIEVSLNAVTAVLMKFMELIRSWQGTGLEVLGRKDVLTSSTVWCS